MSQQMRIDFFYKVVGKTNNETVKSTSHSQPDNKFASRNDITPRSTRRNPNARKMLTTEEIELSPKKRQCSVLELPKITLSSQPGNENTLLRCNEYSPKKIRQASPRKQLKRPISPSETTTILLSSPKKRSPKITKTSPIKYLGNRSSSTSPRRALFKPRIDTELTSQAIEFLNSNAGLNKFDLEEIYSTGNFDLQYSSLNVKRPVRYKVEDVVIPHEKHADNLFHIIVEVFGNPRNCGYFIREELDFIFLALTLSADAQKLLARMLKRKHSWHRAGNIKYPDIRNDLQPIFDELEKNGFITSNTKDERLEILLQLLRTDEVKDICQKSKVDHRGSKDAMITRLLEMANTTKALFPGMGSPSVALSNKVFATLGYSMHLTAKFLGIMDRILTMFMPSQDDLAPLSDIFLTLTMIHEGSMQYPTLPAERHPLFSNRDHLLRYVESKKTLRKALLAREEKDWETLLRLGRVARDRVTSLLEVKSARTKTTAVPTHVKKFTEEYIWMRVLMVSLEAFKKNKETIPEMVQVLTSLLNQKNHWQSRRGRWYDELALIEMHHNKNLEASAKLVVESLMHGKLTEVDVLALSQRGQMLIKRRTGLSLETKLLLQDLVPKLPPLSTTMVIVEANAVQGNMPGYKSTWSYDMGEGSTGFMKVEHRAMFYYRTQGYQHGLHCEGALPITLFTLLLWKELYTIPVPGAFASPYQTAPLDLYTSQFYENRKEQIEDVLSHIASQDVRSLCDLIEISFEVHQHYLSLMPTNLFLSSQQLREVVQCLGTEAVVGICRRLAKNYNLCRAGFPDLIVWNPIELKCKIVEVKGPGDNLSGKQTLWLQYLEELGVATELCIIQAKGSRTRRKS